MIQIWPVGQKNTNSAQNFLSESNITYWNETQGFTRSPIPSEQCTCKEQTKKPNRGARKLNHFRVGKQSVMVLETSGDGEKKSGASRGGAGGDNVDSTGSRYFPPAVMFF